MSDKYLNQLRIIDFKPRIPKGFGKTAFLRQDSPIDFLLSLMNKVYRWWLLMFTLINPVSFCSFRFLNTHCFQLLSNVPGGPLGPGRHWLPGLPSLPWSPRDPMGPCGPGDPAAPAGPAGPVLPGIPGIPGVAQQQLWPSVQFPKCRI